MNEIKSSDLAVNFFSDVEMGETSARRCFKRLAGVEALTTCTQKECPESAEHTGEREM
jgi:hypothetical protein